jgi:glycosyltransferase involved in cell wall biosynthesis
MAWKADTKRAAMIGYTFFETDERLKRHVRALRAQGFAVDVISLRDPRNIHATTLDGVRVFRPLARQYGKTGKLRTFGAYALFTLAVFWVLLRNSLRGNRYDLLHVNNMPNFIIFGALPFRIFGVPVLLDVHDTMPEIYQDRFGVPARHWMIRALMLEERVCMKLADFVLTTEDTKLARLRENGLEPSKTAVTLNLADTSVFPEPALPTQVTPAETFRVVYHGTLAHRLGVDLAIRAVAQARANIPGLRLEIYGDGEQREMLNALISELALQDHVYLSNGFVPMEDLVERLLGADLAVIPSRSNVATALMLPVKLLEYARLGIPVLATPTKTIRHYFGDGKVAYVAAEDAEALAAAFVRMHTEPERRLALARAARGFFARYTFENERQRYQQIVLAMTSPGWNRRRERVALVALHEPREAVAHDVPGERG